MLFGDAWSEIPRAPKQPLASPSQVLAASVPSAVANPTPVTATRRSRFSEAAAGWAFQA